MPSGVRKHRSPFFTRLIENILNTTIIVGIGVLTLLLFTLAFQYVGAWMVPPFVVIVLVGLIITLIEEVTANE